MFSALEYVSVNKRAIIGPFSIAFGLSVAGCTIPWTLKYIGDWKPHQQIFSSLAAVAFVTPLQET